MIVLLASCASSSSRPAPTAPPAPTATPATSVGANAREPKLAPPLPGSYAALGASETYGIGATPHTNGYAYQVARALHAKRFVDVGIPGTTLDAGYDAELTSALAIRPSLCTVFFGVNDLRAGVTLDAYLQNLHDLVATLRQAHAQVLIVGLPDVSKLPAVEQTHIGGLQEIVSSWNAGIEKVARQTGAHVLDLRQYDAELAAHPDYIAPDGLHPSTRGHTRLAQVVLSTVRQEHLWRMS